MTYFAWIMIAVICFIVVKSLIDFIQGGKSHINMRLKESRFSSEIFYTLLIIYSIVIIGFGLIYFILSFQQIMLVEGGELRDVSVIGSLIHSFYFSGVTLLTIGYGDITPRSEEHTSELQSRGHLVCRLLLEKKKTKNI